MIVGMETHLQTIRFRDGLLYRKTPPRQLHLIGMLQSYSKERIQAQFTSIRQSS